MLSVRRSSCNFSFSAASLSVLGDGAAMAMGRTLLSWPEAERRGMHSALASYVCHLAHLILLPCQKEGSAAGAGVGLCARRGAMQSIFHAALPCRGSAGWTVASGSRLCSLWARKLRR